MHISKSFNHGKGTSSYYNTISNSEDYTKIIGEGEEQNEIVFSYITKLLRMFCFMADYINAVSKRVQYTLFGYVTKTLSK